MQLSILPTRLLGPEASLHRKFLHSETSQTWAESAFMIPQLPVQAMVLVSFGKRPEKSILPAEITFFSLTVNRER